MIYHVYKCDNLEVVAEGEKRRLWRGSAVELMID